MTYTHHKRRITALRRLSTLLLVLSALVALTATAALAAPPSQDPVAGEAAWGEYGCKNCHGESGEGLWAGPLAGHEKTAEEWINQVRSPRRAMPSFSPEQISDEVIADMHAYLTALTKPEDFSPAQADLPADAPAGQLLLVEKRCVACHGTTGPINGFIARDEVPTADAVITQLRSPRNNMPSFSVEKVSDAEASQIAEFLALQVSPSSLPASGGGPSVALPVALLLVSGVLVLLGLVLRIRLAHL